MWNGPRLTSRMARSLVISYTTGRYHQVHYFPASHLTGGSGATEPTEWETVSVPADEVRHKLQKMKPKTDYGIMVQAVSDRGPGVKSDTVRVKTLPLAPKPPEEAEIVVHGNNTVVVTFDAVLDPEDPSKTIKVHLCSPIELTKLFAGLQNLVHC